MITMHQTFVKLDYPELPNFGHVNKEDFNEDGLRWPLSFLEDIGLNALLMPLPFAAQFVDRVCFEIITANDPFTVKLFEKNLFNELKEPNILDRLNTTGIGNLAFICLYCKEGKIKEKAQRYFISLAHSYADLLADQFAPTFKSHFIQRLGEA